MPADTAKDLLLITSASGKQASALLPLLSNWKNLRLAVHSESSKKKLQERYPRAEVIATDLYSPQNCVSLLKDVTVCIHVGPSYHPHEKELGYMMIDAASHHYSSGTGKFKHFILSSVLHTQFRKMINHDDKRYIEEYILESELPYTILQPTTFMDNLPIAVLLKMGEEGKTFLAGWSTEIPFSWVALKDLAEVFEKVLREREKHFFAEYPLVSTHSPTTWSQVFKIIEKKGGKEVKLEKAPYDKAVENLLVRLYGSAEGVDQRSKDAAQRMVLFYDNRGLIGNSNVMEWMLGREATQFEGWVEGKVAEARRA